MTYKQSSDPLANKDPEYAATARNWYGLANSDIGAKELPRGYARALRVRMSSTAAIPVTLIMVPIDEADDDATRTVIVDQTEYLPMSVRRIVSINGSAAVPSGVNIDVITS